MALSSGVALAGIGIAVYFWLRNRSAADADGAAVRAASTACCSNKYYVDELYDAVDRAADQDRCRPVLWKGVDAGLIDGAVNGVGAMVQRQQQRCCAGCRPARSATYAASLFLGAVVILGYYLLQMNMLLSSDCFSAARRRAAGAARRRARRPARARRRWSATSRCCRRWSTFAATLLLWWRFDPASADFQFVERHAWMPQFGIQYHLGVDGISLFLIVLTGFLTPLALLSSWESVHKSVKTFSFFMLALESAMLGVFVSIDLFLFYIFWDAMLIPMYFLIGIWGYERRIYAAVKFILYTMAGSVLMLIAIIGLALRARRGDRQPSFDLLDLYSAARCRGTSQRWLFLAFALAFAIKVPLFPFHTWLPDAHVEAPTAGSVILAGVLLKMGTYGLLRFAFPLFPEAAHVLRAVHRDARGDRHHLRRAGRDGAARHEEAGRLLERQPPRLRRARACAR